MNVLAIQRRRVGDILMTTPALRALKARFPQAELTYVCERPYTPLLRSNREVDTLLPMEPAAGIKSRLRLLATLRQRRFDLALDFESSPLTASLVLGSGAARRIGYRCGAVGLAYTDRVAPPGHTGSYAAAETLTLLSPLGIDLRAQSLRPTLSLESRAREWAERTLEAVGVGPTDFLLTLAPAARTAEKRWPLESFGRLLDLFAASHAFELILLLGPEDERLGEQLARLTKVPLFQLSTPPSLPQIAALLDRADLHVGNDNGSRHMAAALGTAAVAVQPPGTRRRWTLPGDPLQVCLEPSTGVHEDDMPGAPAPDSPPVTPSAGSASGAGTPSIASAAAGTPPLAITRITPEEVYAAILALEAYLPRLKAARRTAVTRDERAPQRRTARTGGH